MIQPGVGQTLEVSLRAIHFPMSQAMLGVPDLRRIGITPNLLHVQALQAAGRPVLCITGAARPRHALFGSELALDPDSRCISPGSEPAHGAA